MTYEKPRPDLEGPGAPYWQAAREHKLVCQKCSECGTYLFPPTAICENCLFSRLEWVKLSGKGTVWSFIIMHQKYYNSFADDLPYNIAVVRSAEGPKFLTNLVGIENEDIKVEMPVEVYFDDVAEDLTLPKWKPV
ncbi:MAG TPA: Zn-ribbon domain-containing OB-fold protein [Dehalococcoidia bacterium]|nr:Zn-ribbon domain-containing OB-fold protein [Dehalococcoidia bacterium]